MTGRLGATVKISYFTVQKPKTSITTVKFHGPL